MSSGLLEDQRKNYNELMSLDIVSRERSSIKLCHFNEGIKTEERKKENRINQREDLST